MLAHARFLKLVYRDIQACLHGSDLPNVANQDSRCSLCLTMLNYIHKVLQLCGARVVSCTCSLTSLSRCIVTVSALLIRLCNNIHYPTTTST